MYMSRFGVKNYKCLADVDIPLTPIHVLIGPNDAGKTSLLEAIAALYNSSQEPLQEVFPQPWDGRELVFHGSPDANVEFLAEWVLRNEEDPIAIRPILRYQFAARFQQTGKTCTCSGENLIFGGKRSGLVAPRGGETNVTTIYRVLQGHPDVTRPPPVAEDDALKEVFRALKEVFRATDIYRLDAQVMKTPAAIDAARRFRFDPDGFGLPTMLMDITLHEASQFVHLRDQFCRLFPQFKNLRVRSETALVRESARHSRVIRGPAVGAALYLEGDGGRTIRAQQASDGAILILGFLALAHLPEPPTLLLIEEPENGIYPKRLGEVIQMLKQMVSRTEGVRFPQIIMTTHSPYVLSFFEPEEVTFLSRDPKRPEAGVRARPLRDAPNIRERLGGGAFYLGELWYNLSEEELFGEP